MPLIECTVIKGYDGKTRQTLAERITDAACSATGAHPDFVVVTINELDSTNYMRGRVRRKPAPAPEKPESIVKSFLNAMQKQDLQKAQEFLAEGFEMTFPGNTKFSDLEALINWSKTRYSTVRKTFDGFDSCFNGLTAVVICHGTLHGTWLDGIKFSNIRFVDRFTLSEGKITSQQVWHDLKEARS